MLKSLLKARFIRYACLHNVRRLAFVYSLLFLSFALAGCMQTAKNTAPPGNSHSPHPIDQLAAGVVGTAFAQVIWRKGRLTKDVRAVRHLVNSLHPLDIIIAKNGHHLTDKLLPGYFSHAMIWTGSEKELRRLGLWSKAALRPLRKAIHEGRSVVDVDYRGVRLVSQNTLTDSDALVVLRVNHSRNAVANSKRYRLISKDLGLQYDFAFDLDTPKRVFCSEFAARLFPEINWTYRSILGRRQLLPDDMVKDALKGRQVSVISYLVRRPKAGKAQLRSKAELRKVLGNHRVLTRKQGP